MSSSDDLRARAEAAAAARKGIGLGDKEIDALAAAGRGALVQLHSGKFVTSSETVTAAARSLVTKGLIMDSHTSCYLPGYAGSDGRLPAKTFITTPAGNDALNALGLNRSVQ